MHVLTAHNSRGHLHAVSCLMPDSTYTAEQFTATMQAQGCMVTRTSLEIYLELQTERQAKASPQQKAVQNVATEPAAPSLDKNREKTAAENDVQAAQILAHGLGQPVIGENLVHPVIGYATVTHFLTLEGQQVAVAVGPHGAGLVKLGEWRPATEADKPFWMRGAADMSPESPVERHEAETCPQVRHVPAAIPAAQGTRMVSLFDLGGDA